MTRHAKNQGAQFITPPDDKPGLGKLIVCKCSLVSRVALCSLQTDVCRAVSFNVSALVKLKPGTFSDNVFASVGDQIVHCHRGSWPEAEGRELPGQHDVEEGRSNLTHGIISYSIITVIGKAGRRCAREMSHLIVKHL